MRLIAIGRAAEVSGFALAGVETAVCEQAADAASLVTQLGRSEERVGLLIVPQWVDRAAMRALNDIRNRQGPPVVLVLP